MVELGRRGLLVLLVGIEGGRSGAEATAGSRLSGCGRGGTESGSPRLGVDIHAAVNKRVRYQVDLPRIKIPHVYSRDDHFRVTKKHVKKRHEIEFTHVTNFNLKWYLRALSGYVLVRLHCLCCLMLFRFVCCDLFLLIDKKE